MNYALLLSILRRITPDRVLALAAIYVDGGSRSQARLSVVIPGSCRPTYALPEQRCRQDNSLALEEIFGSSSLLTG
jgi:hypothetical protein